MRHTGNYGGDRYSYAGRPPLEALPADVAKLVTEHDSALVRLRDAERERERLAHRDRDEEARQADADSAATAARAGKKIPPAAAEAKLENDRETAARAVDAHRAAVKAIRDDLDEARETATAAARPGDADRAHVETAAAEFITALEQAIADRAAYDWMRGAGYSASAQTWAVDVMPALTNHGMSRKNGSPVVNARAVVTNLVLALMED